MKFIDLFAGLGGFHLGLSNLGHECVFASEIDEGLRTIYKENFGLEAKGDIQQVKVEQIPSHDILCAGFPCQPFSKAGFQGGLGDVRGTLFHDIARILKHHKPRYFILENVPNLTSHDSGNTWETMRLILEKKLHYRVEFKKLSPHQFGVPQFRERIFIVGSTSKKIAFNWPEPKAINNLSIKSILDRNPKYSKKLPEREKRCLAIWQRFLQVLPREIEMPSFPIWSMEFGATYPFEDRAPYHLTKSELNDYFGSFGSSLYGMSKKDQLERLPRYARGSQGETKEFPIWKKNFIRQNRLFYLNNKVAIDSILSDIEHLPPSWQKFEWNCKGESLDLDNKIIQFRGSGIRVKRTNYAPALVASTSTQIPVIGWEKRYITINEAARLQCLDGLRLPPTESAAYRALGNAVNVKVVQLIAENLVGKVLSKVAESESPYEATNLPNDEG